LTSLFKESITLKAKSHRSIKVNKFPKVLGLEINHRLLANIAKAQCQPRTRA